MELPSRSTCHLSDADIRAFLARVGELCEHPTNLYLLGGSALILLGSPRPTVDLDYVGSDLPAQRGELEQLVQRAAVEMQIEVEAIPFQDFLPLPSESERRHVQIGQFGKLTVYVFDLYSIALSKIERGFESDLEDVVFLLQHKRIELQRLIQLAQAMLTRAPEFALDAQQIHAHLNALERMI
ncbi:MAG: hypothetical protein FJ009_05080 [Chloroflexi bacterium]|nr:hypothetical protein [Chloroflexota bacterium]